jgi:nucleoside-diphosphate-sugar epimerase
LRIFQPYGLGQDQNRLIPWLIESLSKSADPVLSNPNDVADWIHASDIADAVLFAIQNTLSSVLDLGTSVPTLNLELKNVVAEMFPKFKFPAEKLRNTSINRGLVMSPRSELLTAGWRPQHDLFESVRSLAKGP